MRIFIRSSKGLLIDWLMAANDAECTVPDPPVNPLNWTALAQAYYAH
jgi:hypothetical protein